MSKSINKSSPFTVCQRSSSRLYVSWRSKLIGECLICQRICGEWQPRYSSKSFFFRRSQWPCRTGARKQRRQVQNSALLNSSCSVSLYLHFVWGIAEAKCIMATAVCVSVCLYVPYRIPTLYCTDPDETCGSGRGALYSPVAWPITLFGLLTIVSLLFFNSSMCLNEI